MKRFFKYLGRTILAILGLLLLIVFLLYLPPVQDFLLRKAERYAASHYDLEVRIGHFRLGFPFDLVLDDVYAGKTAGDTLVAAEAIRLRVNIDRIFRKELGPYDTKLRKNADGTQGFAITENLVLPTQADLKIGKRAIPIIMVPEGKLTITLDSTNVKFDGDYAALCTELQTVKDNLETSGRTFFDDIRGMTPLQYKQFIVDTYQANKKVIDKAAVSKACKTYARVQLDINYIGHLLSYKTYLSMSNMISKDSTAQKNLETPIDSASYFKGLSKMSILRSVNQRYYPYYCELDNKPLGIHIINDELSDNLIKANKYGKKLTSSNPFMPAPNTPLSEEELQTAKTEITCQPVLQLLLAKNEQVAQKAKADAEASKKLREEAAAKGTFSIIDIPEKLAAGKIIETLIAPYKGKTILIDFWNTWCMPCRAAMKSIKPIKEEMKDIVYIYIADATSPIDKWNEMIPDIHGIHTRISNPQSTELGKQYNFDAIPTYVIIDKQGHKIYQHTGFPGIEALKEALTNANKPKIRNYHPIHD